MPIFKIKIIQETEFLILANSEESAKTLGCEYMACNQFSNPEYKASVIEEITDTSGIAPLPVGHNVDHPFLWAEKDEVQEAKEYFQPRKLKRGGINEKPVGDRPKPPPAPPKKH